MIICAALLVRMKYMNEDIIIPCWRHANGYKLLTDIRPNRDWYRPIEGFLGTDGTFYTREEAWNHAIKCGQLPAQIRYDKRGIQELFSEDLY